MKMPPEDVADNYLKLIGYAEKGRKKLSAKLSTATVEGAPDDSEREAGGNWT